MERDVSGYCVGIWNHRNKVVFKEGVVDHEEIFSLAQLKD